MKILVAGHSFVVDSNRKVWAELAKLEDNEVDIIIPSRWKSNLIPILEYKKNEEIDQIFRTVFPVRCFLKGNGSIYFFNPFRVFSILFKNKYDVIILAQETWSLSLFWFTLFRFVGLNRRAKFFIWICQNIKKKKFYFLRFFERLNCSNLTSILCCCSEAADVIRWKGISIPCQYFPFSFDQKSYEKIPLKESPKEFIIGYMGRLSEEKGLKDLVAAVEKLVSEGVNIKLHLAGGGPLTESLKNHPNIQYYGILKHAEAHKFYKKIDLFVLPSLTKSFWKEQFGRVIVESVASGRPVLGSSSGAIPEVLGHLELPYVFKEGDVNELVSKIRMVMKDYSENRMQKVISKAYELDHQKFSNESVAKRMNTYAGGNSDEGRV